MVKVRKVFFQNENSHITRECRSGSNWPLQIVLPFCPITVSAHKYPDVYIEAQWQKTKIKTKWRKRQSQMRKTGLCYSFYLENNEKPLVYHIV